MTYHIDEANRKCCLTFSKYRKLMEKNRKNLKKVPNLLYYYEIILYGLRDSNIGQIKNCPICSHPNFIKELIYQAFFKKLIFNEMSLPKKEKFRQYLTEKYVRPK